ncbi:MAG: shikimate dehydrogenase [Candidatus Eisenbacteria bacterium]|nr:shikimate dehydrogenase [Candidatus Eisenbacteria bacterium]
MNWAGTGEKTSLLGILGFPLIGSLSPAFQNEGLRFLGLDYVYVPFSVKPPLLRQAIAGLKALGSKGFNVAAPFKMCCIPFLDGLSHEARECGAVNTVVKRGNKFVGYNTEGKGFLRSLDEARFDLGGKNIVVMGGGGAARAISFSVLKRKPCGLTVLTRKSEAVKKWLHPAKVVSVMSYGDRRVGSVLSETDLLVNATVVGMSDAGRMLVDLSLLKKGAVVFDIIFSPSHTRFLKKAREGGFETLNGLSMLLWQGVFSFELWTGGRAPVEKMRDALARASREAVP